MRQSVLQPWHDISSQGPYFDAKNATFYFKKYLELEPINSNREKIELWLSKYGTK